MDEFWNVAQKAMDLAVETAETVSRKGKDFAADSAEEATRQLKNLQLKQRVLLGNNGPKEDESIAVRVVREDMQREMEEYGITEEYIVSVQQLDYSAFRDFQQPSDNDRKCGEKRLNKWQERHALLLVKNVKAIDELRFVLCPKYMDDGQFWETYFELMKDKLPRTAFSWTEKDALPRPYAAPQHETANPLDYLESQFKNFGQKASSAVLRAGASAGLDVSKILPSIDLSEERDIDGDAGDKNSVEIVDGSLHQKQTLLDIDPDLEEYLGDTYEHEDGDSAEDSDIDEYLNELTNDSRDRVNNDDSDDDADVSEELDDELNDSDVEALLQDIGDDR